MRIARMCWTWIVVTLALAAAAAPATGQDLNLPGTTLPGTPSLPATPVDGVVDTVLNEGGEAINLTSEAVCDLVGDATVCAVKAVNYAVATTFQEPGKAPIRKVTSAQVGVTRGVSVNSDTTPDFDVLLTTNFTVSTFILTVTRRTGTPTTMPLQIEALIAEPTPDGGVINVGYDARSTFAPATWKATATVTLTSHDAHPGESDIKIDGSIDVTGRPSSMAVLGGRYDQGPNGTRAEPQQARLAYTPVPANATVLLDLQPNHFYNRARLYASSPSRVDYAVALVDGAQATNVNGFIQDLRQPVTLVLDQVNAQGNPVPVEDRQRVRLSTAGDVAAAKVEYETRLDGQAISRLRVLAETIPTQVTFTKTPTGILVDASGPVGRVAGGFAEGRAGRCDPPICFPTIPVPSKAPFERTDASYVQQDTTNQVRSTTFRVLGLAHVKVDALGTSKKRAIQVGARLRSGPIRVIVSDDGRSTVLDSALTPSYFEAYIEDVPHNFDVTFAPAEVTKVKFCGSSSDLADPCSSAAQGVHAQGIQRVTLLPSFSTTPLFQRATHLSGFIRNIPSTLSLDVEAIEPTSSSPRTKLRIEPSRPLGQVILRATDGAAPPADPADNGFLYRDGLGLGYYMVAKVNGLRKVDVQLDDSPDAGLVDVRLAAAAGHTATFAMLLGPTEDRSNTIAIGGRIEDRPATSGFVLHAPEDDDLTINYFGKDDADEYTGTGRVLVNATGLSDEPTDKVHNIRIDASDVPGQVSVRKPFKPEPVGDEPEDIEMTLSATGPIGSAYAQIDNGKHPSSEELPPVVDGQGYVTVFSDDERFFVRSAIRGLQRFELDTKPNLIAELDVKVVQDFRAYINTGMGESYISNENGCEDWEYEDHNIAHEEFHDITIKDLQPNLRFKYLEGDDGEPDPCKVETHRNIEYSSDARASQITYETNSGDMANLRVLIGQEGENPLKVPKHLSVCQAEHAKCLLDMGRNVNCQFISACDTKRAAFSAYLETYNQRTHAVLEYCMTNKVRTAFGSCDTSQVREGAFLNLNVTHLSLGYNIEDGIETHGFLSMNTKSRDYPNHQGITGGFRYIDHEDDGVGLEYATMSFGYDDDEGSPPPWDGSQGSKWTDYHIGISNLSPAYYDQYGEADCVDPGYFNESGPAWTYMKVIMEIAGNTNSPDDPGRRFTDLLCQGVHIE